MTQTTPTTSTLCANCAGGDGFESCRRDGGCSCACHLSAAEMEMCEYGTDPFTADERGAIARYGCRVAGVPDCFDSPTLDGIPDEFSVGDVIGMFRAWSTMLTEWREAIRTLREDLTDGRPLSVAGRRYLQYEMTDWKVAQEGHRVLIAEYFLGHDQYGDRFEHATTYHGCELTEAGYMFADQG